MKKLLQKGIAFVFVSFVLATVIHAQINLNDYTKHESKIFEISQLDRIQSHYVGADGLFSHDLFLRKKGIYPRNKKIIVTPYFTVSYKKSAVISEGGKFKHESLRTPVSIDFYVEYKTSYNSVNVATPIWDGRVYQDNNEIIVGGYSSKFNERPIAKIDEKGNFVAQLQGEHVKEFPILQIPADQILFDPFEWKLLKIEASNGKEVSQSSKQFLPIDIYGINGEITEELNFEIIHDGAYVTLFAYLKGQKIAIADCNLNQARVVSNREGYQPKLIEGCSQPENGKVVTFVFEGELSGNVISNDAAISLSDNFKAEEGEYTVEKMPVKIDGDFKDWRNIKGVSDYEGDYVRYLYGNPDTDLLEVKITNDDKYLYMYSRVVGVHGRTGDKGRYYWYSYIDVDQDVNTGYPPTRGDNCYFGIPIGDDSEAQFEFIGNKFIKTFYGFTGLGAEKEALSGVLNLGSSYYSKSGKDGKERDRYKVEYVNNKGTRSITHDYTPGTSEDIIVALSPDGSEVEVKALLKGFLVDQNGKDLMYKGKKIDIAFGVEGSSDFYGEEEWGADSSPVIYDYLIK